MIEENLNCNIFNSPFPHLIVDNFYNNDELNLIWEELNYYTKPGKLMKVEDYGGIVGYTTSKALSLDLLYKNGNICNRNISNILTVNRKLFNCGVLNIFSQIHDCCNIADLTTSDFTKVRYYHNDEYYKPHTDKKFHFLAFSYFYKEPKKFEGGELYFPKYDYELKCDNNSMIIFPAWVEHGVKKVSIENSNYFDGWGRYAITSFLTFVDPSVQKELDKTLKTL